MKKLINAINGNIRNTKRLVQFEKVCAILNIKVIRPIILTKENSWFAGFLDGDGTVVITNKYKKPQFIVSVTNKYLVDVESPPRGGGFHHLVEYYQNVFGGSIFFDKSQNGYYKWTISSKKDILNFIEYIKKNPLRTTKLKKLMLFNKYNELKDLNYYKSESKVEKKIWDNFLEKWSSNN